MPALPTSIATAPAFGESRSRATQPDPPHVRSFRRPSRTARPRRRAPGRPSVARVSAASRQLSITVPSPIAPDQRRAVGDRLVGRRAAACRAAARRGRTASPRDGHLVAQPPHDLGRALGLRLAGDPQRDRAGAHVGRRVERHVLDVDAGAPERQGDLGDGPGPVLDRDPQLVQLAADQIGLEQAAAVLERRRATRRPARASPDRISSARSRSRSETASTSPPPPRGWWRRCRPRSRGSPPRPGSCREARARPRAGARTPRRRRRPPATSTLAITCGRWLTVAISRSWVSASIACGRAPRSAIARCRRSYSRPLERSVGVRYQRAPSNRSARAFSTPEVSAPASGWPPMNRSRSGASAGPRAGRASSSRRR